MPDTQFEALRLELHKGGVAPVYIERTLAELEEHYLDLRDAAVAAGQSPEEAARHARLALGSEHILASAVLERRELLCWNKRWPRLAECLNSAASIGTLPGLPLVYCIDHRPELARWGAAIGIAATLVSGVLTALDWLIYVG